MVDMFSHRTVEELVILRDKIERRLTGGGGTSEFTAAGVRVVKGTPNNTNTDKELLLSVKYSLFKKDPDTYANPYADRVRRTRPHYL